MLFLAFQIDEAMENQMIPNLSLATFPPFTKPLKRRRCSTPPSVNAAETPSHFSASFQQTDRTGQLKNTRVAVSNFPQPPIQDRDELILTPCSLRLSLVGNLLWKSLQIREDVVNSTIKSHQ
ncbi:hypothetical protein QL285_027960 [Trifolium repens]|nr:hypothetical protein QL285_027960 [Trifolium repens]